MGLSGPAGQYRSPATRGLRYGAVIDAGHGGETAPAATYGSPGARRAQETAVEKDINLNVAQRVCEGLGSAGVLSRSGDYSVALRERIERARAANAAAFVSIHSNTGRTDHSGPEVWIFGHEGAAAGTPSRRLGERIRTELASLEAGPVALRAGDLALLRPELHGRGVAACLIETGSLRHPSGRAKLTDRRTLDQIGDAVARGVSTYLEVDFNKE